MDEIIQYYNQQAQETRQMLNLTNNTAGPLTFDPEVRGESDQVVLKMLVGFLLYLIVFPSLLLCWFTLMGCLKRRGLIRSREASSVMDELEMASTRALPRSIAFPPSFSKRPNLAASSRV